MSEEKRGERPAIIQAVMSLKQRVYLSPHYIRITLTGEDVHKFANTTVGVNNKIFIPPPGVDEVYFPSFDFEKGNWIHPPEGVRPFVRTYTHRGIDLVKKEIIIDFVAHGDNGPASAWAMHAKAGDKLGLAMRDGYTTLVPQVGWYLLVADATGLPVMAAILESLPASATGVAYIEVQSKEDQLLLPTASKVEVHWLIHPIPGENTLLADAVRGAFLPDREKIGRFAYVTAEFSAVRDIRNFLRKDNGWQKDELYAYAYWKQGNTEDHSALERHQEQASTK